MAGLLFTKLLFAAAVVTVFGLECPKSAFEFLVPKLADFGAQWETVTSIASPNFLNWFEQCDFTKTSYYHREKDTNEAFWYESTKLTCFPGAHLKWWEGKALAQQCSGVNHVLGCLPGEIEAYHKKIDPKSVCPQVGSTSLIPKIFNSENL